MLVACWNVNSVNVRLERLLGFLERVSPDVVCLQELKCEEGKFPFDAIRAAGYHAAVWGQRTYNGVAILAKEPLTDVMQGFQDGEPEAEARLIAATVRGVRVLSVYVPNGQSVGSDKYHYKLRWLARLARHLERQPSEFLIAGDFNIAPEDRDVHDPEAWRGEVLCSDAERAALQEVTAGRLVDTFRLHEPGPGKYSWWDYRNLAFPRNRGLRIDFVFASQALAPRCEKAWIERDERKGEKPSDHAPCLAQFS